MAFGNRLINTGSAAESWSLENAFQSNTITATGGSLNYNQYAYTKDNRIVGISNSKQFYMYAMSGSSATLYGGINTNYATSLENSTFEQSRFVLAPYDAPTTGYFYISCQDQSNVQWKIAQINLNTNLTWNTSSGNGYRLNTSGSLFTNGNLRPSGFDLNSDGTKVYIATYSNYQTFSLSTPYQLNTATLDSTSTDADLVSNSFTFKPDGTRIFIKDGTQLKQYDLSTPYDISTKTLTHTYAGTGAYMSYPISFTKDGTKFYTGAYNSFKEYTCG